MAGVPLIAVHMDVPKIIDVKAAPIWQLPAAMPRILPGDYVGFALWAAPDSVRTEMPHIAVISCRDALLAEHGLLEQRIGTHQRFPRFEMPLD